MYQSKYNECRKIFEIIYKKLVLRNYDLFLFILLSENKEWNIKIQQNNWWNEIRKKKQKMLNFGNYELIEMSSTSK